MISDEKLKILNDAIEVCVRHGGDCGGCYYSSPKGLAEKLWRLAEIIGYSEDELVLVFTKIDEYEYEYECAPYFKKK